MGSPSDRRPEPAGLFLVTEKLEKNQSINMDIYIAPSVSQSALHDKSLK